MRFQGGRSQHKSRTSASKRPYFLVGDPFSSEPSRISSFYFPMSSLPHVPTSSPSRETHVSNQNLLLDLHSILSISSSSQHSTSQGFLQEETDLPGSLPSTAATFVGGCLRGRSSFRLANLRPGVKPSSSSCDESTPSSCCWATFREPRSPLERDHMLAVGWEFLTLE